MFYMGILNLKWKCNVLVGVIIGILSGVFIFIDVEMIIIGFVWLLWFLFYVWVVFYVIYGIVDDF